jgi:uncharacterized protein YigE (DUF2233 family)
MARTALIWLGLAAASMAASRCMASEQGWHGISQGLELRQETYGKEDPPVQITLLRLDPKVVTIQVIDVVGAADSGPKGRVPDYTLVGMTSLMGVRALAIMNGGFASRGSLPLPAGLLVDRGKVVGRLNRESRIQTGIFCVGTDGRPSVVNVAEYNGHRCRYAVQAGPLLVEKGKVPFAPDYAWFRTAADDDMYPRSVVAIDNEGKVILAVASKVGLFKLGRALVDDFNAAAALNLGGSKESSLCYRKGRQPSKLVCTSEASAAAPIASAIAVLAGRPTR